MPLVDPGNLPFSNRSLLLGKAVTIDDSGSVATHVISAINSRNTASDEVLTVALTDTSGVRTVRDIAISRLTEIPVKVEEESPYKGLGAITATPDEATEWFVFVMLQAASLFQAIPGDARDEIQRLLEVRGGISFDIEPALAYYDTALNLYENDDD